MLRRVSCDPNRRAGRGPAPRCVRRQDLNASDVLRQVSGPPLIEDFGRGTSERPADQRFGIVVSGSGPQPSFDVRELPKTSTNAAFSVWTACRKPQLGAKTNRTPLPKTSTTDRG